MQKCRDINFNRIIFCRIFTLYKHPSKVHSGIHPIKCFSLVELFVFTQRHLNIIARSIDKTCFRNVINGVMYLHWL